MKKRGRPSKTSQVNSCNFDVNAIFNQAKMRYNQLFAAEITIVIPGDFSLHAGDSVYMDIPQTDTPQGKSCGDDVSKLDGGKYLITDLCHYITARDTYTKLVMIRDESRLVISLTRLLFCLETRFSRLNFLKTRQKRDSLNFFKFFISYCIGKKIFISYWF